MSGAGMNRFETWERNNLARFCQECYGKLKDREQEIETLKEQLRVALDAYQRLLEKHVGKTD